MTTPIDSETLARIARLYDEQRALWARSSRGERLEPYERERLRDIAAAVERLWHRRRLEKTREREDGMTHIAVDPRSRGPRFAVRRARFSRRTAA